MTKTGILKRTPLYEAHLASGARMVDFAGWEMPVQYTGPLPEHMAVRQAAGLFDVSHMGEIEVIGDDALALVQRITTNDVSKLEDNQVQYSLMTTENGGVIDDLLVYRLNREFLLLIVNAAGIETDFAWIKNQSASHRVEVRNVSAAFALLAIQGPCAERILQPLTDHMLDRIPYYWSEEVAVENVKCRVSRTGYTGEDGFEILCNAAYAGHIWKRLLRTGKNEGLIPCGLAARNTLRLEAAFRLYGNDMDQTTTPLEAGLAWTVKLQKGDFIGRDVLRRQKEQGLARKLVGFEMMDKAPARDGYPVSADGREVGVVASGSPAPFLKKNIGLVYLPIEYTGIGTELFVSVRGRLVPARVAETPFYKREKTFD
ncbi:MAG TPA: glycine cleavage system aminomethyltransferase GcvT [Blastocatellia bacterium]|nr:glycine cleavage system aminomethyltransferase GcvT [Blastocatellia bacterium]